LLNIEEGAEPVVARLDEVVQLYCSVFNGVSQIQPPWTVEQATRFMRERARRTGLISTLLLDGHCLVGAFIAVLAPKADGIWISDADLLVRPDYRAHGLGRELYHTGHLCAERTAIAAFGERPAMIEFSTYRHPDFPKNWWLSLGYRPFPLFSAGAAVPSTNDACAGMSIRNVVLSEVDAAAAFMAGANAHDLNGWRWTRKRAALFLQFMIQNQTSLVRVVETDDGLAALIAGELVLRRSGPFLTHITYVGRNSDTVLSIALADLVHGADRQCVKRHEMPLRGLELADKRQARRLRPVLPDIGIDEDFLGMSMTFDRFTGGMRSRPRSVIQAGGS
jgi:GNAT superfamily N-acetyltransferase